MGAVIGYARVSTDGQSVHDQTVELKAAGASRTFPRIWRASNRPMLRKALAALDGGDTLMVVRLDRLARSTRDLLNILHEVGDKRASFKSLHDCWADTTTPHGRLMLTILGGLAEFERSLIKARTDVGINARASKASASAGRQNSRSTSRRKRCACLMKASRRRQWRGCWALIRARSRGWRRG